MSFPGCPGEGHSPFLISPLTSVALPYPTVIPANTHFLNAQSPRSHLHFHLVVPAPAYWSPVTWAAGPYLGYGLHPLVAAAPAAAGRSPGTPSRPSPLSTGCARRHLFFHYHPYLRFLSADRPVCRAGQAPPGPSPMTIGSGGA